MKVLVTGNSGQLARALVEQNRGRFELKTCGRPELDLEKPGSATAAINFAQPDAVINAAAYTAVDGAEDEPAIAARVNGDAAGEVARAAAQLGIPVLQISTDYVFDGRGECPRREEEATAPLGVYGRSKLVGEEQVRAANARHVIIRTAWVYSPFGNNFVKSIMAAAQAHDVINVVEDQRGNPTSALDLADGLLAVLDHWNTGSALSFGQTYHLAGAGVTTWYGFAVAIMAECARLGLPHAQVIPIATVDWPTRAIRPANSQLSCETFTRDFGFRMPAWNYSLAGVVKRIGMTSETEH